MTTDVSSALETLQLDPDNKQALSALASLHPGNGSGVDRGALAHALTDARRFHRERGDFELCVQLIDLELAWTIEAPKRADLLHEKGRILSDELLRDREGQECVRQALEAVPDHAASLESQSQMGLVNSNWEPISKRYLQQAETATDPEAARLAEEENRADVIAGVDLKSEPDDVAGILIDLAQRETKTFSLKFAHTVVDQFKGHTPMHKRPMKSAGFVVLKAPDVPSVLLELGYMSNRSDLTHLESPQWRANTADELGQAVDHFFAPRLAGTAAASAAGGSR